MINLILNVMTHLNTCTRCAFSDVNFNGNDICPINYK